MREIEKELKQKYKLNTQEIKEYQRITFIRRKKETESLKELGILSGTKILECGTGRGRFTESLRNDILSPHQILYTVDSCIQCILRTKNLFKKFKGESPRKNSLRKVYPIIADICHLPFPDNFFDVVISHYTLHGLLYKNRDSLRPFKEMVRVLKPRSPLIAMTFYYDKKENLPAYIYHRLVQLNYQDKKINFLGLQKPEIYKNFLKKAGLKGIKSKVINFDSFKLSEELKKKIEDARLEEEKNLIKKIKSSKIKKEAERVLKSFKDKPELKIQNIGPTILIWGKK